MELQAIILAAGKGTRLNPITNSRSKAMLPVVGKPVIVRIMDSLAANGIIDFVVVVNPEDAEIIDYFRVESNYHRKTQIIFQQESLGMANALSCAAPLIHGDFLLSACDNLVSEKHINQLINTWKQNQRLSAILSCIEFEPERAGSTSTVKLDGQQVTRIIEKPAHNQVMSNICSLPLYLFSDEVLHHLKNVSISPRGEYELQDFIQMIINLKGRVLAVMADCRLNLTNPSDLLSINRFYLNQKSSIYSQPLDSNPKHYQTIPPIYIEGGTIIGNKSVIGPNVYIEPNCIIGNYVRLKDTVVLKGSIIPDQSTIQDQVVCFSKTILQG